ncbi:hypothetical protein Btru_072152 [Bulinus truncatus]|nr:hypothetical protein Btru_072152 [Bulinus truncatus]
MAIIGASKEVWMDGQKWKRETQMHSDGRDDNNEKKMNDREYEKHSFERDEKVNHTGNDDDAKEEQSEREEVDEDKDLDSYNLANPLPPPDVDLDKLRGDRIGDTVYSGKWCIQTVIKLMQSNVVAKPEEFVEADEKIDLVDMEEELQNEVGVLWDMTSNVTVYLCSSVVGIYKKATLVLCGKFVNTCIPSVPLKVFAMSSTTLDVQEQLNICGNRCRVELSTGKVRPKPWLRGGRGPPRSRRAFNPDDRCYECGERGHYAYDCSRNRRGGGGSSRRKSRSASRSYSRSRSRGRRDSRSKSRSPPARQISCVQFQSTFFKKNNFISLTIFLGMNMCGRML